MSRIEIVFNDLEELSESMKNINSKIDKIKELMNNGFNDARQDQLYRNGFNKIEIFLKNINKSFDSTDKRIKEYNDEFRNVENTFSNKFSNINTPIIEKKEKILVEIPESALRKDYDSRGGFVGPIVESLKKYMPSEVHDIQVGDGIEKGTTLRDMYDSSARDISSAAFDYSDKDMEQRKMYGMSKRQQSEDEYRRIQSFPEYETDQQGKGVRKFNERKAYGSSISGSILNNPRNYPKNSIDYNKFFSRNKENKLRDGDDYR